jgi:hypothetical protein
MNMPFLTGLLFISSFSSTWVLADNSLINQTVQSKSNSVESACQPDIKKLCSSVPATQVLSCLKSKTPSNLTADCAKQVSSAPAAPSASKVLGR